MDWKYYIVPNMTVKDAIQNLTNYLTKDNYIGGRDGAVLLQCDESEQYPIDQGFQEVPAPPEPQVL